MANSTRSNSRKLPISQLIGSIIIMHTTDTLISARAVYHTITGTPRKHGDDGAQYAVRIECFENRLRRPTRCVFAVVVERAYMLLHTTHTRNGSIIHSICHVVCCVPLLLVCSAQSTGAIGNNAATALLVATYLRSIILITLGELQEM